MKTFSHSQIRPAGFTLLDVVLAIAIFAFGMLALIQLQGGLARSHSDANYRTVAVSLAEEMIEEFKGFSQPFASDNGRIDYAEIASSDGPELRTYAGTEYSVETTVTDYYHVPDPDNPEATPFSTEKPVGVVLSDFKLVELRITWNPVGQLVDLESNELLVREIIPSTPSLIGANIVADDDGEPGNPPVTYTPGERPDIVSLSLGEGTDKFKESTKPQPDVNRGAFQTWFDVVTYSQGDLGAVFLRREEFLAVKCECELFSSNEGGGMRPTLWGGYEYTEGEFVNKYYGERATGTPDDLYCDICCRDHHDGGSTDPEHVYDPFGGGSGDHPHYGIDDMDTPVEPNQGKNSEYVEACRLVRKDGFMRVTHDASQQTLNGFPEGYLSFTPNIDAYSAYVTSAVSAHYEGDQLSFDQPEDVSYVIPASTPATATDLPTVYFANSQQLRSRAVYTDYLTREARDNLNACFDNLGNPTPDNQGCNIPNASSPLEVYPFFDLQMTWLNRWNEKPEGDPVDVTNEPIQTGNTHSRGLAICGKLPNPACIGGGQVDVMITSHNGNLGLTATGAIDPDYASDLNERVLFVDVNQDNTPMPDVGKVVAGSLTSGVRGVEAADLVLTPDNALCGQTDVDYSCLVSTGGGTLTVSNYSKNRTALWVCSDELTTVGSTPNNDVLNNGDPVGGTSSTTFALPASNMTADIYISDQGC